MSYRSISNNCSGGEERSGLNVEDEVIICIEIRRGRLGASVLDCKTKTLKVMNQDFILSLNCDGVSEGNDSFLERKVHEANIVAENLILRDTPTKCLLSARLEEANFDHVAALCQKIGCSIEIMINQSFKNQEELELPQFSDHHDITLLKDVMYSNNAATSVTAGTVNCIIYWTHKNFDCDDTFDRTSTNVATARSQDALKGILHVESLQVMDRVFLDEDSLHSLSIFPEARRSGRDNIVKDGCFSLFELLDNGLSEMGKKLLRAWLFSPLSSRKLIKKRYEIINILLHQGNTVLFDSIHDSIKGLPDVLKLLDQFRTGRATYNTWCSFNKFLIKACEIYRVVTGFEYDHRRINLFSKIKNCIDQRALNNLSKRVEVVIDIEASEELKCTVIREGVDAKLDALKETYNGMERILGVVAREAEELLNNPIELHSGPRGNFRDRVPVNAVYIPQLGYLVTIDVTVEEVLTDNQGLGWKEVFRTTTNVYYKNQAVLELDEEIGDVFALITDLEIEILQVFQEQLLGGQGILIEFHNYLLELEVLIGFAHISRIKNYVEPEIYEDECILQVSEGRHPLYETLVETYIPNDIELRGGRYVQDRPKHWSDKESHRVAIITGANQSGKSVFLTQNGLIVFMAHIGCFVPADRAKIGLVDKILTRIRTRESVSKNESSFALDSQQMAKCLSLMTEKSLILVDEFGKGTDVIDGPSIFGSIVSSLAKSSACPRVLACTHFHELFNDEILSTSTPGVKHYATEIILHQKNVKSPIELSSGADNQGITFLFKITEGISKQSFGIYSAKICGVKGSIVDRAQELSDLMDQGHDMVSHCASLTAKEISNFHRSQEMVKKFLAWDLDLESRTSSLELKEKLDHLLEYRTESS